MQGGQSMSHYGIGYVRKDLLRLQSPETLKKLNRQRKFDTDMIIDKIISCASPEH